MGSVPSKEQRAPWSPGQGSSSSSPWPPLRGPVPGHRYPVLGSSECHWFACLLGVMLVVRPLPSALAPVARSSLSAALCSPSGLGRLSLPSAAVVCGTPRSSLSRWDSGSSQCCTLLDFTWFWNFHSLPSSGKWNTNHLPAKTHLGDYLSALGFQPQRQQQKKGRPLVPDAMSIAPSPIKGLVGSLVPCSEFFPAL